MRDIIYLVSTANTGFFYTTTKNTKGQKPKIEVKKYDPVAKKHVIFKESKKPAAIKRDLKEQAAKKPKEQPAKKSKEQKAKEPKDQTSKKLKEQPAKEPKDQTSKKLKEQPAKESKEQTTKSPKDNKKQ